MTLGNKVENYIFNTTKWLSYDVAPGARQCFGVGLDTWNYVAVKQSQFNQWADVGLAWMQSMLGNSVTFQALITKITKAGLVHDIV